VLVRFPIIYDLVISRFWANFSNGKWKYRHMLIAINESDYVIRALNFPVLEQDKNKAGEPK